MDDQTKDIIQDHIDNNEVCLFMKGTPDAPQCGFSMAVSNMLKILEVSFNDYESNKDFYNDKINTAKFYFEKVLPRAEYHYKSAISGSSNIMNFKFN